MFKVHLVSISDKVLHDGRAESVVLPGVVGEFEIQDLHVPIVSLLKSGEIIIRSTIRQASSELSFKSLVIQQGLMRFDGKELYAVVE